MMTRIANVIETERETEADIEITPEMIRAGVSELVTFNHDFESEESAVERIFHAMINALH